MAGLGIGSFGDRADPNPLATPRVVELGVHDEAVAENDQGGGVGHRSAQRLDLGWASSVDGGAVERSEAVARSSSPMRLYRQTSSST